MWPQVVGVVAKCGDTTSPDVQLAVVRALLTITTAEHFRAHGDCLVQVCGETLRQGWQLLLLSCVWQCSHPRGLLALHCSSLRCCCG